MGLEISKGISIVVGFVTGLLLIGVAVGAGYASNKAKNVSECSEGKTWNTWIAVAAGIIALLWFGALMLTFAVF